MAGIGLVSPGVKVREVDLTVGRIDSISDQTGAIVGPFERGPVLEPLLIENEQDMIDLFGKPKIMIDNTSIGTLLQTTFSMVVY